MSFDFTAIVFYAIICGGLAVAAPTATGWMTRASIGIAVGVIAAAILPLFRGMMGY
ncbi:MAG: hypothetical protein AAFY73_08655 [Pseudomonadota bacterium]